MIAKVGEVKYDPVDAPDEVSVSEETTFSNKCLNVLGTEYSMIFKEYDEDDYFDEKGICGYCDGVMKEIVIGVVQTFPGCEEDSPERCERMMKETMRHEIVHAFMYESGLGESSLQYSGGWSKNEEMIDWIASQGLKLYDVWKAAGAI